MTVQYAPSHAVRGITNKKAAIISASTTAIDMYTAPRPPTARLDMYDTNAYGSKRAAAAARTNKAASPKRLSNAVMKMTRL